MVSIGLKYLPLLIFLGSTRTQGFVISLLTSVIFREVSTEVDNFGDQRVLSRIQSCENNWIF